MPVAGPKELLEKAFKLIEKPESFTQGTFARDKHGHACDPKEKNAVCFCSWGAVNRTWYAEDVASQTGCVYHEIWQVAKEALDTAAEILSGGEHTSIVSMNDNGGHAQTIRAWKHAIETLTTKETEL